MKTLEGIVISNLMQKTVIVEVSRVSRHKLYKKIIKKSKKYKVDASNFEAKLGDKVKIAETKPISKEKNFKVTEIIKK
ncbi:MAG: 30S ribosomal protein S17 [Microgenomates group bacterium GW2011_GWC1_38_14]|nr:MAG: 30S ribosomal protein S17 [Candidatus Levybacteria bacterium GW2011_GWA2_36_13]KKQ00798.1 MAG: 30S ribosomal protein S17 [Candidatus Levybacteria bacterium GW2011_GWB1_36_18]KKQ58303.1 MAG: 30S ribosomal protein S17 [Microgenomates group bacterium GW2011_GWC1_38_14]KKR15896.1 MAG: 30S ribosomal protein S17 [Candidatus Levybacteria bacterium GW2011_GWA1_39_32]OGH43838.1 MAG: 30S ribosomal protein S17 [Candidatus Levybacteria bacterium RIFCSPLOWO2_02_FULL_37_11]